MEQNVAEQRDTARARLGIEGDLRKFQSSMRAWKEDEDCETNAMKAYKEAVQNQAWRLGSLKRSKPTLSLALSKRCSRTANMTLILKPIGSKMSPKLWTSEAHCDRSFSCQR